MFISSKQCTIEVTSSSINDKILKKDLLENPLLYRFVPDLNFQGSSRKITLKVENCPKPAVKFSLKSPLIHGKYKKDFDSTDIIVVAEYLLERMRQELGITTVHSSCIYKKDKAILLLANLTGAGKTSLALYLTKRYGFKLFSDEKALVSLKTLRLVGQTKKLFLEPKTKNLLQKAGISLPSIIPIRRASSKKIALLITPVVTAKKLIPAVYQYKKDQLKWLLYEEFSKDIRLVNGLVLRFSYPLLPLDNFKLSRRREQGAEKLSRVLPSYFMVGDLKSLAERINQIFDNKSLSSLSDLAR